MTSLVFKRMITTAFLLVSLSACGNILGLPGGGDAPQIFDLKSSYSGSQDITNKKVMLLDTIAVSDTLKSNFIVVKPSPQEYSFIKDVLWSEDLPSLIEKYLVRQYSGPHLVVSSSNFDLKTDYRIRLDVEEFSAIMTGGKVDHVEVSITATLFQNTPLKVLKRKNFSQTVNTNDNASDIVSAMNGAMAALTKDLSDWTAVQ